jgi:17beta-estradiol 17-dehydrogenase / very-long-chain 3-oxoacyl-CoA reductase
MSNLRLSLPHCPWKISKCWTTNVLMVAGAYTLASAALSSLRWVYIQAIARSNLAQYGAHRGAYALVTGASEGIGKALALEGAARGFNLVLIARRQGALEVLRAEIIALYPFVNVIILPLDCSDEKQNMVIDRIVDTVQNLDLAIVWNNVGVTTDIPTALNKIPNEEIRRILQVNNTFTVCLTARLIPHLKRRDGKSIIANISSFLSLLPACNYSTYASSKAFLNHFTECMSCELMDSNVSVVGLRPAHVVTRMSWITESSFMVPTAHTWAKAAWDKLGVQENMTPYMGHALQELMARWTPSWFIRSELKRALQEP